jgi:protochlorophyllide reductase
MTTKQDEAWTIQDAPDQSGRTAVITGASTGLGLETARALASRGANVILACRDLARGERAANLIASSVAADRSRLRVVPLELASLTSIHGSAEQIHAHCPRLDLLINNAGVMAIPFSRSDDGFERTFATNHLGHFALTGLLLDRLLATPGSRVVTLSSNAHRRARFDLGGLDSANGYKPGQAYDRSKLANLLFAHELQHRLHVAAAETISLAAHPGNARTDLWRTSSRLERALLAPALRPLTFWLAQSARDGALPTLRAALDPAAEGGDYYGPAGWFEYTGQPVRVDPSPASRDRSNQRRLWLVSEQLTGVSYPLPGDSR